MKTQKETQMMNGKSSRGVLPNGSSMKNSISGRNSTRGESVKLSRNVHANIDFSELNEVCLDVGKVDLSHTARFRSDSNLSPYKCSRDNFGDSDLGKRASKLPNNRSQICVPRKKNKDDEAWRGWNSKIVFHKHGLPVVNVLEQCETTQVLVMTEDVVERECKILKADSCFAYYRENFDKYILGVNRIRESESIRENSADLRNKICEYFADNEELESFLESIDCSLSLSNKRTFSRQLDFDSGNTNAQSTMKEYRQKCKREKAVKSSSPVPEDFLGFSPNCINKTNKRARKFLDYYTKFKKSSASLKNLVN